MTLLAGLVRTSARVAESPGGLAKIRELAEYPKRLGETDAVRPLLENQP